MKTWGKYNLFLFTYKNIGQVYLLKLPQNNTSSDFVWNVFYNSVSNKIQSPFKDLCQKGMLRFCLSCLSDVNEVL